MSKVLSRDGYVEMVRDCYAGMDWARDELEDHDAAQRAHIAELGAKLAALQHIGTGAGQAVGHKHE